MALPVTLCISTRNAGAKLAGCIESARPWTSELVIVDMESSDDTLDIASSYGATVVHVPPAGWAEPGRQAGIEAATQPWLLVLDADERAASGLEALVASYTEQDEIAGVWLPRQNFWFGWWVPGSGMWPDWQLRLFQRERTTWPGHRTHVGPVVKGKVVRAPARVENAIVHESIDSMHMAIEKMNHYTDLEADRLARARGAAGSGRLFGIPILHFLESYVRNRGYRGGRYGLNIALLSFIYWLVAQLKVWERRIGRENLPPGSIALNPSQVDAMHGPSSPASTRPSPPS